MLVNVKTRRRGVLQEQQWCAPSCVPVLDCDVYWGHAASRLSEAGAANISDTRQELATRMWKLAFWTETACAVQGWDDHDSPENFEC